jgi:dienelactone hydrolase
MVTKVSAYLASILVVVLLFSGTTTQANQATPAATEDASMQDRIALFKYDNKADLNVKEAGVDKKGNVSVHDISFTPLPGKDPVKAYLVVPDGKGPFAGILWVHWLGEPETTNRTEFLNEAISLASNGTVSLLVDAMWSAPKWYGSRVLEEDYQHSIEQVVSLRRAMDLLVSQPGIDTGRIGFVGHDYGAMYGTLMAGVDPRAKTYVFLAAVPSLNDWAFFAAKPKSMDDYLKQMSALALTDYIHQVKNASILFQDGNPDEYVSQEQAEAFFAAANPTKAIKIYDGVGHAMETKEVMVDRDNWLIQELGLALNS